MTTPSQISPPRNSQQQRGAAMLIMVLILMLGLITLFTFRMDRRGPELAADRKTAMALAQAKEALLGNSATNGIATASTENPGRLPCPDLDNDGGWGAGSPPTCPSKVGRLPWKFLGIGDLRDGAAEGLWYVVDLDFVDTGAWMNSGKTPTLAVNGNQVVAVIIAPGPALAGQQRDTANENILNNYLESYGGSTTINLNSPSSIYNDRMITITAKELFNVVTQRMVREFVKKLVANGTVSPYPSSQPQPPPPPTPPATLPPDVWFDNQWNTVVIYSPTPLINATQFTLQFANCASVFTVTRTAGPSNTISRVGNC